MHKYGAIMIPVANVNNGYTLEVYIKDTLYTATGANIAANAIHGNNNVGYTLTLTKQ